MASENQWRLVKICLFDRTVCRSIVMVTLICLSYLCYADTYRRAGTRENDGVLGFRTPTTQSLNIRGERTYKSAMFLWLHLWSVVEPEVPVSVGHKRIITQLMNVSELRNSDQKRNNINPIYNMSDTSNTDCEEVVILAKLWFSSTVCPSIGVSWWIDFGL